MSGAILGKNLLYLSQTDVESVGLGMAEILDALETAFREKGEGRVEMPAKIGVHPLSDAFLHAMPATIPAQKAAGMKWVAGFPQNSKLGLPYVTGLLILNDFDTGLPLAVMDCVWITAKRTGAATALAAKYLANPESESVGILGCGVQGQSNLEALKVLFPLKRAFAYDTHPGRSEAYAKKMSSQLGLQVISVSDPKHAVSGCDIVVTAGPILRKPHATIQPGWLDEGAFASLVDFDSYWHPDALRQAGKFCTDDTPQLEYYRQLGYFQDIPPVHAELGELVTGKKPGRQDKHERTFACNLGIALDDLATAPLVYARALKQGIGMWLPL